MPIGPQPDDVRKIRLAVSFYKVSSIITGTFLLGLVVMMVLRYGFGVDIELLGAYGFLALTPLTIMHDPSLSHGINFSTVLLSIHGWFYVLYVAIDFVLWRLIRWSFGKFLFIALGGVIPLLSYFLERRVPRDALAAIAHLEKVDA